MLEHVHAYSNLSGASVQLAELRVDAAADLRTILTCLLAHNDVSSDA
jgi:hypothetical protein